MTIHPAIMCIVSAVMSGFCAGMAFTYRDPVFLGLSVTAALFSIASAIQAGSVK